MMGARELLPVFFSYCRRMLRAFLLVALGGATLFVVTILYRAPLELPLYTCCLVGAVGAVFFFSGFARYYRRHAALRMLRAQCATKLAALPAPRDILEKDYGDIIAALERLSARSPTTATATRSSLTTTPMPSPTTVWISCA